MVDVPRDVYSLERLGGSASRRNMTVRYDILFIRPSWGPREHALALCARPPPRTVISVSLGILQTVYYTDLLSTCETTLSMLSLNHASTRRQHTQQTDEIVHIER